MKKLLEFFKSDLLIIEWTIIYFSMLWAILWYLFGFDIFLKSHWWKFFHTNFHSFIGIVFCLFIYTAIPIYIATIMVMHRTKKPIMTVPILSNIFAKLRSMCVAKSEPEPEQEQEPENEPQPEYPENLPSELRVPFIRMKQKLSFLGMTSSFNQPKTDSEKMLQIAQSEQNAFPIPTDFDISDSLPDTSVPTFTDINFDEPKPTPQPENETASTNSVTQYFDEHDIDYETYKNFVITTKNVIYIHSDTDFWIMDNDTWFAAGKQIKSPVNDLIELAKENNLTPIIYLESTNIMDLQGTIEQLNKSGIKTVTDLSELN